VVTGCRAIPPENQGGVWSVAADGSMVGNGQNGPGSSAPVTLVRPDGQVVVLDSNSNDFNPSISPDGSKVAFARLIPQDYQGAWPSDLYVVNTDGSGLKQIASGGDSQLGVPTFSPDGSTIAYSCQPTFKILGNPEASTGCGPLPDGSRREFATLLVSADGSDTRVILLNQSTQSLSWSADGRWIATESVAPCTCSDGNQASTQVFMYHTDGSDLFSGGDPSKDLNPEPSRQITHDDTGAMMPQFTAGSSSQLVYYKAVDDSGDFWGHDYMINVDGTDRHELSLSTEGAQYGLIIPATGGAGPPTFVNVMRVPVPSVHSLGYQAAKQRLRSAHLRVGKTSHRFSSRVPRNHVLSQKPRGGGYAHRTTRRAPPVKLTLSRGPHK
jgi:dipeptidyl aminopeptidase/acylaminoacyl peptidase